MVGVAGTRGLTLEPQAAAIDGDATVRAEQPPRAKTVSVIIPVVDEAEVLPATITAARDPGVEIIVVDGGSTDGTVAVAQRLGARVLLAARGRGTQLARGADAASGDVLLFLHADSMLPPGYVHEVRRVMTDPACAVGAFRLRIDAPGWIFRMVEWGVGQRCRWLGLPYGDQGLFVRAALYRELGGFSSLPSMEDLDFVRRARRRGAIHVLRSSTLVSSRSWRRHGVLRFSIWNILCALGFSLGVVPARIADRRARWLARTLGT